MSPTRAATLQARAGAALGLALVTPWGSLASERAFPDAESYWAGPIEVEGQAHDHEPVTRDLSPDACARCHVRQFEEWRGSWHARAVSPGLLGQLGALPRREQRGCLACHVPPAERQAVWEDRGLEANAELHGVDCAACHVRNQRRFGPRARPHTPHGPVAGADFFRVSEFCAPCHQFGASGVAVNGKPLENTHGEWATSRYGREGVTCQSCHMPGGDHRFAGIHDPAMAAQALRVEAVRTPAGVEVRFGNEGAGHALPTYTVPRIRIGVSTPDSDVPDLEHAIQRRMDWDADRGWRELADTRLMPGEFVTLAHPLPPSAHAEVTVHVEPDADYFERVYPALIQALAGEVSREELALLEVARQQAGDSAYTLLRLRCAGWQGEAAACEPAGTQGATHHPSGVPGPSVTTDGRRGPHAAALGGDQIAQGHAHEDEGPAFIGAADPDVMRSQSGGVAMLTCSRRSSVRPPGATTPR